MIVAFGNNQVMVAEAGSSSVITTDPVPMNENDRGSAILNVHYIYGGTSRTITYVTQSSNDGVIWVTDGPTGGSSSAGASAIAVDNINGAFVRVQFTFEVTVSGQGACCFDLHMRIDHV